MVYSTGLRAVANTDPFDVRFGTPQERANVWCAFYDASDVLVAAGTLDLLAELIVTVPDIGVSTWTPPSSTVTLTGGTFDVLDLGAGHGVIRLTPSSITPPGGATQYVIACNEG